MKQLTYILSILSIVFLLSACGGGKSTEHTAIDPAQKSLLIIENYANGASNDVPSLEDYHNVGADEVTASNLQDINSLVHSIDRTEVDTQEEVRKLFADYQETMGHFKQEASDHTQISGLSQDDYEAIGIKDVTSDNIDVINTLINEKDPSEVDTIDKIRAIIDAYHVTQGNDDPVADTTPPVITLNGSSTVTIIVNDSYADVGATALDNIDGSVTVTTAGSVDTIKAGTYTITYTASDKAGNTATKTRTVTVNELPGSELNTWYNESFNSKNGLVITSFKVYTSANNMDTVIGFSKADAAQYTDLGIIVRFAKAGAIDARDGQNYVANTTINYERDKEYTFDLEINFSQHVYTAYVTLKNGDKVLIGEDFSFRSDQSKLGSIDTLAHYSTNNGGIILSDFTISSEQIDITKPVITLIGKSTVNIKKDSTYVDKGATALDDIDGDISTGIIATSSVDASKKGEYRIIYNVDDDAGNSADEVKRIVIVRDTEMIHPGVYNTQAEIDFVKAKIAANKEPWKTEFEKLKKDTGSYLDINAKSDYAKATDENGTINCTNKANTPCDLHKENMVAIYANTLMYKLTGETAYANKATKMLHVWTNPAFEWGSAIQNKLMAATSVSMMVRAAELLMHDDTFVFPQEDAKRLRKTLTKAYIPILENFSGTPYMCGNNWEVIILNAMLSMYTFMDDRANFDLYLGYWEGLLKSNIYLNSDGDKPILWINPISHIESISPHCYEGDPKKGGPWKLENESSCFTHDGQPMEYFRDLGHVNMSLTNLAFTAEIARIQNGNTSLYDLGKKRLTLASEHTFRILNGNGTLRNEDSSCEARGRKIDLGNGTSINAHGMLLVNHYVKREKNSSALPETQIWKKPDNQYNESIRSSRHWNVVYDNLMKNTNGL